MRTELIRFIKALIVSIVIIGLADLFMYQEFAIHFKLGVLFAVIYTVGLMFVPMDKRKRIKKVF